MDSIEYGESLPFSRLRHWPMLGAMGLNETAYTIKGSRCGHVRVRAARRLIIFNPWTPPAWILPKPGFTSDALLSNYRDPSRPIAKTAPRPDRFFPEARNISTRSPKSHVHGRRD